MLVRRSSIIALLVIVSASACLPQASSRWDACSWLIGTWKGSGTGKPGKGTGQFTFFVDPQNGALIRTSRSEYPAAGKKKAIRHDDRLIITRTDVDSIAHAAYLDNEGHVIDYNVAIRDKELFFLSEQRPEMPVYRLIYRFIDPNTVYTSFETSKDGKKFTMYLQGKSRKVR